MRFFKALKRASEDETGAVTVDWVVLTASLVTLGTGVISAISGGLTAGTNDIKAQILSAGSSASGS